MHLSTKKARHASEKRKKNSHRGADFFVGIDRNTQQYRGICGYFGDSDASDTECCENVWGAFYEPENEAIVPTPELTEEEMLYPEEEEEPDQNSTTPARDAMRRLEREEGRRRRTAVEVPNDETLRVAPVDQRPEFIAQGMVDDSQTRVFTPVYDAELISEAMPEMPYAPAEEAMPPYMAQKLLKQSKISDVFSFSAQV